MASFRSVNESTFVPNSKKSRKIYFSDIMKSNSSLTMNRAAGDTIAAIIQVLTFFSVEGRSTSFCIRMIIIIIVSKSGDKSNVTYN